MNLTTTRHGEAEGPSAGPTLDLLTRYLGVLRRRWPVVALVFVIAVGATLIRSVTAHRRYNATAQIVLGTNNQVTTLLNPNASTQSPDTERDLNTQVALIAQGTIADAVRQQLHLRDSRTALLKHVSTQIEGTTNLADITVDDTQPAQAAKLANAFATQYVAFRQADARAALQQAVALAQSQLSALSAAQLNSPQGQQVRLRLGQLQVDSALQTANVKVSQYATAPTSPSSPRPLRDGLLAGLLGLIAGLGLAGTLDALDRRLRDEDDVASTSDLPILVTIPQWRKSVSTPQPDRDHAETFRALATNLRFFKLGREVKVLMITSPSGTDGKTAVTLGLAAAFAEMGHSVIAMECDLRRPTFSEYLGVHPTLGLSSILSGMAPAESLLIDIDARTQRPVDWSQPGAKHFSVLPCGPVPPNPQALMGSSEMRQLATQLRRQVDVVLVDTPPLGTINDAVSLGDVVDGVAVVARLRGTRRDRLKRTLSQLSEMEADVLGMIVTGGSSAVDYAYYGDAPRRTGSSRTRR